MVGTLDKRADKTAGTVLVLPSCRLDPELKRELGHALLALTEGSEPKFARAQLARVDYDEIRILQVLEPLEHRQFAIDLGNNEDHADINVAYSPGIILGIRRKLTSDPHAAYQYEMYLATQGTAGTVELASNGTHLLETPEGYVGVYLLETSGAYSELISSAEEPTMVLYRALSSLRTKYIQQLQEPDSLSGLAAVGSTIKLLDTLARFAECAASAVCDRIETAIREDREK